TLHILQTSKIASNYSLRITSILGETVFINKPNSSKSISIDISGWANGLYIVNCESAAGRRWMKFIKH
ncbi:MAG: T9SS type A sorting domain-containing protein, partial [Bacteroidia bacterium]|nr:T9SS type A sorting domain-containing protein [Bacteroidia bacterium]